MTGSEKLDRRNVADVLALTPSQLELLEVHKQDPDADPHRVHWSLELAGEHAHGGFEKAWRSLVRTHDLLRTVLRWEEIRNPIQVVLKDKPADLAVVDLSALTGPDKERARAAIESNETLRPFDLKQAAYRLVLCRTARDRHRLLVFHHPILVDRRSAEILGGELLGHLRAPRNGGERPPVTRPGFGVFIRWLQARDHGAGRRYWDACLEGWEAARLPGRRRPTGREGVGFYERALPELTVAAATHPRVLLCTAWTILLMKYTYQRDVVAGVTAEGRPLAVEGAENMVGPFAHVLPLRLRTTGGETARELLERVERHLEQSREWIHPEPRPEDKDPLCRSVVEVEVNPLALERYYETPPPGADIALTARVRPRASLEIRYRRDSFDGTTIRRVASHLARLATAVLGSPGRAVRELDMLSPAEKCMLTGEWNDTRAAIPAGLTLDRLLAEASRATPERTALVYGERRLTYGELDRQVSRLASYLRGLGVRAESPVGVLAARCPETVVSIFAVLRAGGLYLPLDPQAPPERNRYVLEDVAARWLLADAPVPEIGAAGCRVLTFEETFGQMAATGGDPAASSSPTDLAYVIYTSGSTGRPKGVMVEHRSAVNNLLWMQERYPLRPGDVLLHKTSITFDVSVMELFWWPLGGACLCLLPPGGEKDPGALLETVEHGRVSVIHFVPAMFHAFLDFLEATGESERFAGPRQVILSGEKLEAPPVKRFQDLFGRRGARLSNLYGPTEATVHVSSYDCPRHPAEISIGRPIRNTTLAVLDVFGRPVPLACPGELTVSGTALARGYVNRPGLTGERFRTNSLELGGPRTYHTGDLAEWSPDGTLRYLGRRDSQIKLRGYRIEPGEIETHLLRHPRVREALVLPLGDGTPTLAAFLRVEDAASFSVPELKDGLSRFLPGYMIPERVLLLDQFPVTTSGKVDRRALARLAEDSGEGPAQDATLASARRRALFEILADLLKRRQIDMDSHFFALGGNSLTAILLVSRIYKQLGIEVPQKLLFQGITMAQLAELLETSERCGYRPIPRAPEMEYYPLSLIQSGLYVQQNMDPSGTGSNMPALMLLDGELDVARLEEAFRCLLRRHESLRTSFQSVDHRPVQRIHPPEEIELEIIRYAPAPPDSGDTVRLMVYNEAEVRDLALSAAEERIITGFMQPFDLSRAPLVRVGLITRGAESFILVLDIHHLISDGISISLLVRDLVAFYRNAPLPELAVQYKDFSEWQDSTRLEAQRAFWLEKFRGELPDMRLPLDFPRPDFTDFSGDMLYQALGDSLSRGVLGLASQLETTLFVVLCSVFKVLLAKYSGQQDVVIGTPMAGRCYPDLENVIGKFVNMIPIRSRVEPRMSFRKLAKDVEASSLAAFENQEYPFEELVKGLNLRRDIRKNALFVTAFALHNIEIEPIEIPGLRVGLYNFNIKKCEFDLVLHVMQDGGSRINLILQYATSLFRTSTMEGFLKHYLEILEQVVSHPERLLHDIAVSHQFVHAKSDRGQQEYLDFSFL